MWFAYTHVYRFTIAKIQYINTNSINCVSFAAMMDIDTILALKDGRHWWWWLIIGICAICVMKATVLLHRRFGDVIISGIHFGIVYVWWYVSQLCANTMTAYLVLSTDAPLWNWFGKFNYKMIICHRWLIIHDILINIVCDTFHLCTNVQCLKF